MHHFSHKISFLVFLGLLLSCNTTKHAYKKKLPGTWQGQTIVVDGANKDWPSPYPGHDDKALISYAMSNDRDNLYITMATTDARTQLKVVQAGIIVWIDTGGAQGHNMAIKYPATSDYVSMPVNRVEGQGNMETDRTKRLQMRARTALSDATQISFEGFNGCNTFFKITEVNSCGIMVRMNISESNELVWEASIPFKALYGKEHISKSDNGRPISVCFNIKAFGKPDRFKNMGDSASAKRNNITPADSIRAANATSSFAEMQGLFETSTTWKQFGLAYKAH